MSTASARRKKHKKFTNWLLIIFVSAVFVVPTIATALSSLLQGREQDRYREAQLQGLYATRLRVDSALLKHVPVRPLPPAYQTLESYPADLRAQAQVVYRIAEVHADDLFLNVEDLVAASPLQRFDPAQLQAEPEGWVTTTVLETLRSSCAPSTGSLTAADAQTLLSGWLAKETLDTQLAECVAQTSLDS